MGGLLVADLLRGIGWQVTVFERIESNLGDRGAAIGITSALLEVMQRIEARIDRSIGVESRSRIVLDRSGRIAAEAPIRGLTGAWSRLYRPLKMRCHRLHVRRRSRRVGAGLWRVTAIFEDGRRVTGDLLIAADGIHHGAAAAPAGRDAALCRLRGLARRVEERSIPPAVHSKIFHHMSFCFPDGEMVLCLPMAAAEGDDERRFQIAWFRPADEAALLEMCTDATGRRHGTSIPPPLLRGEVLEVLRTSADARLPAEIAALLAQTTQPILQPIFDCVSPRIAADFPTIWWRDSKPGATNGCLSNSNGPARTDMPAGNQDKGRWGKYAPFRPSGPLARLLRERHGGDIASAGHAFGDRCPEARKDHARIWSGRSSRRHTHRRPARKRRYVAIVSQMTRSRAHPDQTASADSDVEPGARLGAVGQSVKALSHSCVGSPPSGW